MRSLTHWNEARRRQKLERAELTAQSRVDALSNHVEECINCGVSQFAVTYYSGVPREVLRRVQAAMRQKGIAVICDEFLFDEFLSPVTAPDPNGFYPKTVTFRVGALAESSGLHDVSNLLATLSDAELYRMGLYRIDAPTNNSLDKPVPALPEDVAPAAPIPTVAMATN
jgi:hypothetical protein